MQRSWLFNRIRFWDLVRYRFELSIIVIPFSWSISENDHHPRIESRNRRALTNAPNHAALHSRKLASLLRRTWMALIRNLNGSARGRPRSQSLRRLGLQKIVLNLRTTKPRGGAGFCHSGLVTFSRKLRYDLGGLGKPNRMLG